MVLQKEHNEEVSAPDSGAELVERRALERIPARLSASAWSPQDPTARVLGETIDLNGNGCLLRLPALAEHASLIDLYLELPGRTVSVRARIVRREAPDLVGVAFESFPDDGQADLAAFRRLLLSQTTELASATERQTSKRSWLKGLPFAFSATSASPPAS